MGMTINDLEYELKDCTNNIWLKMNDIFLGKKNN